MHIAGQALRGTWIDPYIQVVIFPEEKGEL